jgi:hypothetical protein
VTEKKRIDELRKALRACWTKEALDAVVAQLKEEQSQVVKTCCHEAYKIAQDRVGLLSPDKGDKFSGYRMAAIGGEIERMDTLDDFNRAYNPDLFTEKQQTEILHFVEKWQQRQTGNEFDRHLAEAEADPGPPF